MNRESSFNRRTIAILVVGLGVWAMLVAVGSFLYGYRQDFRKPLVVCGAMVLFLGVWGVLLLMRATSGRRRDVGKQGLNTCYKASENQEPEDSFKQSTEESGSSSQPLEDA